MTIALVGTPLGVFGSGGTTLVNSYVPTNGNLLVISGGTFNAPPPSGLVLTDSRGNTIPSPTTNVTIGNIRQMVWLIPNCIGGVGNFTLSVVGGGSTVLNLDISEYSGASLTATLDGTPATNTAVGGVNTISSGNITLANAGSMLVCTYFDQTSSHACTFAGTAGLTERISNNGDAQQSELADNVAPGSGTFAATINWSAGSLSSNCLMALIGILPSGGAPSNSAPIAWVS